MKHALPLLASFTLLVAVCSAQPHMRYAGGRQVMRFKTIEDSVALSAVQHEIDALVANRKFSQTKLDSLMDWQREIMKRTYYVTLYEPQGDFTRAEDLAGMESLDEVINVSLYRLKSIPPELFKCKNLVTLEFIRCEIDELPAALNELPQLRRIYLYNNITRGHLKLHENNSVTRLEIRTEDPATLPKSFKSYKNLELLDLSENRLSRFPNGARKNKKLKELNLQRNELTLRGKIKKHRYLERLALHGNKIQEVPSSISKFQNLRKLNFNLNSVAKVHRNLGKLKKVEQLSFYSNQLEEIPEGAYEMSSLLEIDLFYNNIAEIKPAFAQWQKLTTLYLSNNKLTTIPENIDTLKNLTGIYLWDNRIGQLPARIGNMRQLKYLRVNRNYLKELPPLFYHLTNLEEIDLSHNYIAEIKEPLFQFPNLKILAIMNNPWSKDTSALLSRYVPILRDKGVFVHVTEE